MQLSTDLPCGPRAVREYIEHRGDSRLPMNVSAEADAAYVADKGLKVEPVALESWPVGTCTRCGGVIHNAPFLSSTESGEFCSRRCRDAGKTVVQRGRPRLTPRQRAKSKAKRLAYQKNLMQKHRVAVLANNSRQPIESTAVTDAILAI